MQVASLCDIVEPALAGSGPINSSGHDAPDDALELQLFELEEKILRQAHSLAKKSQGHYTAMQCQQQWVLSKEDLARFKLDGAKLLALQRRKTVLDEVAAELDAEQAEQPAGIMERAERDFSGQSLGASSGQLAQLAAHHVHLERYHASEPEQRAQWSMSVQPAPHVAHESHVSQPDGGPSRLDWKRVWGRLWRRSGRRSGRRSWRTAKKRKII